MSNALFPTLLGLGWPVKRTPKVATIVQKAAASQEVRIPEYSQEYPEWELPINHARMSTSDYQTLYGFFCARLGPWDSFLFEDPDDHNTVSLVGAGNNLVATGDGTTKSWQLTRMIGSGPALSTRQVFDINGITYTNNPISRVVYVNGVVQAPAGYTISSTGMLTFTSAPPNGQSVAADFSYAWRVRFSADELEFEEFASQIHRAKKVVFQQVPA